MNVGASNAATWTRLTEAIGRPELRDDPRFAENGDRMAHLVELCEVLGPVFLGRGTAEWLGRLGAAGVPAGPVASIGEMLEHPQTRAREMVVEVEHGRLGTVKSLGSPVKLSGSASPTPRRGAPRLGEHTLEVLEESGWSRAEALSLLASGAAQGVS